MWNYIDMGLSEGHLFEGNRMGDGLEQIHEKDF